MVANPEGSNSEASIEQDLERVKADERRLVVDLERLEHDVEDGEYEVRVEVNGTRVILPKHKVTGYEIKEIAIEQGATLEIDFQLWRLKDDHTRTQIGDAEIIETHDGERFAANAPDDNA